MVKDLSKRTKSAIIVVAAFLIGICFPGAGPLKIAYIFAVLMAITELLVAKSQTSKTQAAQEREDAALAVNYEVVILAISGFVIIFLGKAELILIIIAVCVTDTGAWFIGKNIGKKFTKTRPFPKISPNKSWEGTIGGILAEVLILWFFTHGKTPTFMQFFIIITSGVLAVAGDIIGSYTKRRLKIKDSSAYIKGGFLKKCEKPMNGFGGYLDRIDSLSLVITVCGIASMTIPFWK